MMAARYFEFEFLIKKIHADFFFIFQLSQEMRVIFRDDPALAQFLKEKNICSYDVLATLQKDDINSFQITFAQKGLLKALISDSPRCCFLPGDTVVIKEAELDRSTDLHEFVRNLQLADSVNQDDLAKTLGTGGVDVGKLRHITEQELKALGLDDDTCSAIKGQRDAEVSAFDAFLCGIHTFFAEDRSIDLRGKLFDRWTISALKTSITAEALSELKVPLGVRKSILALQTKPAENSCTVKRICAGGTFSIEGNGRPAHTVHFAQLLLRASGKLYSSLSEMGFVDREQIVRALVGLHIESADWELASATGERLIDELTNPSAAEGAVAAPAAAPGPVTVRDRARALVERHAQLLHLLRHMHLGLPFAPWVAGLVAHAFAPGRGAAAWTWGAHEPRDMVVSSDGLEVTKRNTSSPDYSTAVGSEELGLGVHRWAIRIQAVQRTFLGVACGLEEAGRLGVRPTSGAEYALTLSNRGEVEASGGKAPEVERLGDPSFAAGQTVTVELDLYERTLTFAVDDRPAMRLRGVRRGAGGRGLRPVVCMDYAESCALLWRTSAVRHPAGEEGGAALAEADVALGMDNAVWGEAQDAALAELPLAGNPAPRACIRPCKALFGELIAAFAHAAKELDFG
jgi:hypothetical protein